MDKERKKRRQTIKLVITEIIMVIAVVAMVVILTLLAMGYGVNKDGELGQSGLVQIKSIPTGATVQIDEETILPRTNTNRMLTAGEHTITLSRDGYDTWTKKIVSESGWLTKLDYARLFLKDRTPEKIREYDKNLQFVTVSRDGGQMIYATEGSTKWTLLNIRGDEAVETELDLSKLIAKDMVIREISWNENNDRLLVCAKKDDENQWLLINIRDISASINLTTEFKLSLSMAKFSTAAGERLLVLENGNLRSILASERTVSQVLARNVESFYNDEATVAYVASDKDGKRLMLYQEGTVDIMITELVQDKETRVALSEYLGKKYLSFSIGNRLYVYRGVYPTAEQTLSDMELVIESDMEITPDEFVIWSEDQLMMGRNENKVVMFDAELGQVYEYEVESSNAFILDNYLVGVVADGKLIVRDFDGGNRRELAEATGRARISRNHKWLYYVVSDENSSKIYREQLVN